MDISMLTPIKIPGKRHRKPPAGSIPVNKRRPGRPRKEQTKRRRIMTEGQAQLEHKILENLESERQISTLENLPTEVLQNIFLQSMNYNLPRASPVLAERLSINYIYIQTIKKVFGQHWKNSISDEYGDYSEVPQEQLDQVLPSSRTFLPLTRETELLKLKWVTPALLLEARQKWLMDKFSTFPPGEIRSSYFIQVADFLRRHPEYEDNADFPQTLEAALHFYEDMFDRYYFLAVQEARPYNDNGEPQLCRGLKVSKFATTDLSNGGQPPESILRGPWTREKLLYLLWNSWAGISLSNVHNTVLPEVANQGLRDAIQEGSFEAISFLALMGMTHFDSEATFKALATSPAPNKAILIVRVLDLFFGRCCASAPKGTWEFWVEDIIKMYGNEQNMSERRQLMKTLKEEIYDYAGRAYNDVRAEGCWGVDAGNTERLKALLERTK